MKFKDQPVYVHNSRTFVMPLIFRIGIMPKTKKLYAVEEKLSDAVRATADEWIRVQKTCFDNEAAFWTEALPQVFFDLLGRWETGAAIAACKAFLERKGFKIEAPKEEVPLENGTQVKT